MTGIVDEELVAVEVGLPHHRAARLDPLAVVRAEGGATQTVGILPQVLLMQQLEGDAFSAQLQMQPGPVGLGPRSSHRGRRRIKQRFELRVGQGLDRGPVKARAACPLQSRGDGAVAGAQRVADGTVTEVKNPFVAKNLASVSHAKSLGRQRDSFGDSLQ